MITRAGPAVLVMDGGDEAAPDEGLAARLGTDRSATVRALLRDRALAWAGGIASDDRVLSAEPGEELVAAAQRAFTGLGGPLLIAWPELPVWRALHGESALADLAHGCGVSVGPVFDGGFYLLALAEPLPALLEIPRGLDAMNRAFVAAHEAGVGIGLLRPERGLRGAGDIAAALADPLLDDELRGLLEPGTDGRR